MKIYRTDTSIRQLKASFEDMIKRGNLPNNRFQLYTIQTDIDSPVEKLGLRDAKTGQQKVLEFHGIYTSLDEITGALEAIREFITPREPQQYISWGKNSPVPDRSTLSHQSWGRVRARIQPSLP